MRTKTYSAAVRSKHERKILIENIWETILPISTIGGGACIAYGIIYFAGKIF